MAMSLAACSGGGHNAVSIKSTQSDRAACAQLAKAMHQTKASIAVSVIRSGYQDAIDGAKRADDPKLRRSITDASNFVLSGSQNPPRTAGYGLLRCNQIEPTFPEPFLVSVVRFGYTPQTWP